jgi:LPXTG-motif cell wall-anchored protein
MNQLFCETCYEPFNCSLNRPISYPCGHTFCFKCVKNSYLEYVDQYDNYSHIQVKENGSYQVKVTSILTGENRVFNFTVDNSIPNVELEGVEVGGNTINDVYIKGYKVGDTIYIYRDGKLVSKVKITSSSTEVPVINEGGSYEVVIESEAGVQTSVVFTRAHIPNTASSILIIITILGIVMALFGGLIFRNRLKVDE